MKTRLVDLPNFTTVFWSLSLIPVCAFRLKKMKQKRTLKMQVKVILRKTQQGNSLSKELKDKYETRIHNSLQLDCWIAIIVVSIVFPACHVFKSYWVEPFCCCWDGEEEEEGGEVRWRSKSEASDSIREKKVCNIFITFYKKMFRWIILCFILEKMMDVPQEEPEEELEEEQEDWEEDPGRGTRKRKEKRKKRNKKKK